MPAKKEISQVAAISANNDQDIGELIADAMEKVGKDGVITVEEAKSIDTNLEVVEGMQFDRGYVSPYFVTNSDTMECLLEDPLILIHDKKISAMKDLLPAARKNRADGQEPAHDRRRSRRRSAGDAGRQQAPRHAQSSGGKGPGLRRPPKGNARGHRGAHRRHRDFRRGGFKLENTTVDSLGKAKRVTIDKENTTIIEGAGKKEDIKGRVNQIRKQIDETTSDYDREKLQERLAKLAGGVAVINIGAATETEMKEKKARVEDALHATRAAVEEGIVAGGGVALIRAATALDALKVEGDEKIGVDIIRRAVEEPLRWIVQNAGMEPSVVANEVKNHKGGYGFNAYTCKYEDLLAAGVIDPTKVVRSALENAATIAGLVLTTECIVTEKPKEEKEPSPGMGGGGMGGMGGMGDMY